MNANIDQALLTAAQDTFASLAFLFPMELDAELADAPQKLYAVRADFFGPVEGTLWLGLDEALLPVLTANMLGLAGEELSEQEQADAAAELLNVICGNLLPQLTSPADVYDIRRPMCVEWQQYRREAARTQTLADVKLPLEGGMAHLALTLKKAA